MKKVKHTLKSLEAASKKCGEDRDCTVRALAVVCEVTYEDARLALLACGRQPRHGAFHHQWMKAAQMLGIELVDLGFLIKSRTVRTLERNELPRHFAGQLVLVDQVEHVAAWDGEQVLDWSAGGLKRIEGLYLAHRVRRL